MDLVTGNVCEHRLLLKVLCCVHGGSIWHILAALGIHIILIFFHLVLVLIHVFLHGNLKHIIFLVMNWLSEWVHCLFLSAWLSTWRLHELPLLAGGRDFFYLLLELLSFFPLELSHLLSFSNLIQEVLIWLVDFIFILNVIIFL